MKGLQFPLLFDGRCEFVTYIGQKCENKYVTSLKKLEKPVTNLCFSSSFKVILEACIRTELPSTLATGSDYDEQGPS